MGCCVSKKATASVGPAETGKQAGSPAAPRAGWSAERPGKQAVGGDMAMVGAGAGAGAAAAVGRGGAKKGHTAAASKSDKRLAGWARDRSRAVDGKAGLIGASLAQLESAVGGPAGTAASLTLMRECNASASDVIEVLSAVRKATELLLLAAVRTADKMIMARGGGVGAGGRAEIERAARGVRGALASHVNGQGNDSDEDDGNEDPVVTARIAALVRDHMAVHAALYARYEPLTADWSLPAVNALARLFTPGLEGDVNRVLPAEEARERLDAFARALVSLGVAETPDAALAAPQWMDSATKSVLVYMRLVAIGQRRFQVTVPRAGILGQCVRKMRDEGQLGSMSPKAGTLKLFPTFLSSATGGTEPGEGHGPRKELFHLLAEEMCSSWAEPQPGPGLVSVAAYHNTVTGVDFAAAGLAPGMRLLLDDARVATTVVAVDGRTARVAASIDEALPGVDWRMCKRKQPLFAFHASASAHWFNAQLAESPELAEQYRFAGWLLAMGLANRVTLDVDLPAILFARLIDGDREPTLDELHAFDPETRETVASVRRLATKDFQGMLEAEDLSASMDKETYLAQMARRLLVDDVRWQFEALRAGFFSVVDRALVDDLQLSAGELQTLCCSGRDDGTSDFDVRTVFRIVADDEFTESPALAKAFWTAVDGLAPAAKRAFLKFVTGRDRLPLAQTEILRIEMPFTIIDADDARNAADSLPQAHTCTNTIELPPYAEALETVSGNAPSAADLVARIRAKLTMAIDNTDGYGLDDVAQQSAASPMAKTGPVLSPATPVNVPRAASPTDAPTPVIPELGASTDSLRTPVRFTATGRAPESSSPAPDVDDLLDDLSM